MASAEYAIQIAASMPEGEATTAQLDEMVAGLTGAGKGADFFQVAIKQVSGALDAAKAAAAAANGALAEGNAQYKELEKAANVAAKAVEKAAAKGMVDPEQVREALQADAALQAYTHTLKTLEQSAAGAAKGEATLATQLANVRKLSGHVDKTLAGSAEATEKLRGGLASVPGPIGKIGSAVLAPVQGFQKLTAQMGSANAAMLLVGTAAAGMVVGVLAVTAAVVAGTFAIAAWAVGLADSTRNTALAQDAIEAMHPELIALRGTIEEVSKATGMHGDELRELAGRLKEAGVSADRMAGALSDAALAETALGKGGANDFIADIKASKGAVTGLANATRLALGGVVAKQMRGLDAQGATFKRNIGALFGDLNIEPVLAGLERLGALFDKDTVAGQAIKFLFESVFQPLINQADKASVVLEAFALGFLIGMTKLYIALKPVFKAVAEFLGFNDPTLSSTLDMVTTAGEFVASVFVAFIGVLGALGVAVGAVVAVLLLPVAALAALSVAVYAAGEAILGGLVSAFHSVVSFLSGFSLVDTGVNIINGLVNGLMNAGPNVIKAITGVVSNAIGAAKKLLGIASPSKVFAEIGGYTGEGFSQGVDDAAPDAQDAMANMVDPAPAAASAGAPAAGASSGGSSGRVIHIENLYLAGAKATEAETISLSEALTRLIQGDAAALGGGTPEATSP